MWVIIILKFPNHTKQGRKERNNFCRIIEKTGFHKIHTDLFSKYCFTTENALSLKKKVIENVYFQSKTSIFLIGDKQMEYSYHHYGTRKTKKREESLIRPNLIEFF